MVLGLNLNSSIPVQNNYKAPEKNVGFGLFGLGRKTVNTAAKKVDTFVPQSTRAYREARRAANAASNTQNGVLDDLVEKLVDAANK